MPRGRDGDIRAYHRVRADVDMRVVNGGEVEVCVYRVAEMDVRLPSLLLSRARGIELVEQIELFELFVEYRLLVRIIELASVHSFIPMVFLIFCFSPL